MEIKAGCKEASNAEGGEALTLGGGAEEEEEEEEGGRKEGVEWRSFSRRVISKEREDLIWALCASISISFASASSFSFSTLRGSNALLLLLLLLLSATPPSFPPSSPVLVPVGMEGSATLISILPRFSPEKRPRKACGTLSRPSTIVSRGLICCCKREGGKEGKEGGRECVGGGDGGVMI